MCAEVCEREWLTDGGARRSRDHECVKAHSQDHELTLTAHAGSYVCRECALSLWLCICCASAFANVCQPYAAASTLAHTFTRSVGFIRMCTLTPADLHTSVHAHVRVLHCDTCVVVVLTIAKHHTLANCPAQEPPKFRHRSSNCRANVSCLR